MGYKKGELLTYDFPQRVTKNIKKSCVICEFHRAVVLHERTTPYHTILIAPITEAKALEGAGKLPPNYLKLLMDDYPMFLDEDSYINPDMTMVVDEAELEVLVKGKARMKITGNLEPKDLTSLDY